MTSLEIQLARDPAAHHASREVVGLCLTPCAFTTLAIIATSTHSVVATLLAIAIVALSPDSDIDPAEAP